MRQNAASVYLKNKWLTSSSLAQSWKSASESGVRLELGDSSFKIDSTHYTVTHHEYGHEYAGKNMPCAKNIKVGFTVTKSVNSLVVCRTNFVNV